MKTDRLKRYWLVLALFLILVSCRKEETTPVPEAEQPVSGETEAAEEPTAIPPTPIPEEPTSYPIQVANYDLGETTILQDHFPEDSSFRYMPVRLEGIIGVPESEEQHPVVLIMHGSHAVCPGENVWPCSAEEEQKNYEGFTYLVKALAEAGYVALSINVNAEHTFGFGEAPPIVRTKQLIDLHLGELAAATAGQSDKFGLDLTGRADLAKMTWMGHSRGGEFANRILREYDLAETGDEAGYGPVQGLVQIAPALIAQDSLPTADLPIATILPACDQDVINLDGQGFYESARLDPGRQHPVTSIYLEGAVHNSFNTGLNPDSLEHNVDRPDCSAEALISAEAQQDFLANYTKDFLQAMFAEPDLALSAHHRLGTVSSEPVPNALYGLPTKGNFLPSRANILPLIMPESEGELSQNLLGSEVKMEGVTAIFCPDGYYVPANEPGTEPCKRVNFNQPGNPQQFVIEWEAAGAELRTSLPASAADLTQFDALQLRVALDPLSDLNVVGLQQAFTVELVDATGESAEYTVTEIEYPAGIRRENDFFEGDSFTGHVHMQTIRIPLEHFRSLDLANVSEIALLFDQVPNGTLFIADLALMKNDS